MSNAPIYALAVLCGLLIFVLAYGILMPKRAGKFKPDNEEETSGNTALRALTILSSEIYDALPSGDRQKTNTQRNLIRIEELLVKSGNPWGLKAEEFVFIRYITGLIGAVAGAAIWFATYVFGVWAPWYVIIAGAAAIGFFYPYITYKERANERDLDFKRNLPEALDLIIISVAAGRTFNQALRDTIDHLKDSYLKEELAAVIRSVDSGRTMKESLNDFADRAPSTSIVTFTRSLQEAIENNSSLDATLRSRSDESRAELFSMIRERTAALPVKMSAVLTPTLSFALMIILLAPFVTSLMNILQ